MNIDRIIAGTALICMFIVFPLAACFCFAKFPRWFQGFRMLGAVFLYSLLSWGFVNGVILLRYLLNPMTLRGPEGVFALFFGSLYLWFTSLPVFLIAFLIREAGAFFSKKTNKGDVNEKEN